MQHHQAIQLLVDTFQWPRVKIDFINFVDCRIVFTVGYYSMYMDYTNGRIFVYAVEEEHDKMAHRYQALLRGYKRNDAGEMVPPSELKGTDETVC